MLVSAASSPDSESEESAPLFRFGDFSLSFGLASCLHAFHTRRMATFVVRVTSGVSPSGLTRGESRKHFPRRLVRNCDRRVRITVASPAKSATSRTFITLSLSKNWSRKFCLAANSSSRAESFNDRATLVYTCIKRKANAQVPIKALGIDGSKLLYGRIARWKFILVHVGKCINL